MVTLFCIVSCVTFEKPAEVIEEPVLVEETCEQVEEEPVGEIVPEHGVELPCSGGKLLWNFSSILKSFSDNLSTDAIGEVEDAVIVDDSPSVEVADAGVWDIDLERDGVILVAIMVYVSLIIIIGGFVGVRKSNRRHRD